MVGVTKSQTLFIYMQRESQDREINSHATLNCNVYDFGLILCIQEAIWWCENPMQLNFFLSFCNPPQCLCTPVLFLQQESVTKDKTYKRYLYVAHKPELQTCFNSVVLAERQQSVVWKEVIERTRKISLRHCNNG